MELDATQAITAALIMGAGAFVQGAVGFGSALVAAPLLWLVEPRFLPGPVILAAFCLTVLVVARERGPVEWHSVWWTLMGRVPGTAAGVWALATLSVISLSRVFAALVLLAVVLLAVGRAPVRTRSTMFAAGLSAGVMGTVTSIGGPPVALMFRDAGGPQLRCTLAVYFVLSTVTSLLGLWLGGFLGMRELRLFACLLPGTLVGFALSRRAHGYLDRGRTGAALLWVSGFSALGVWLRSCSPHSP